MRLNLATVVVLGMMDDNRKQIADLTGLADVADSGTYAYRALTNAFYFS